MRTLSLGLRVPGLRVPGWVSRLVGVLTGWALLMFIRAQPAAAATITAADKIGQTPPALAWIQLKDSHGVSIWHYELSLDRGGVTSPGKFFWSTITDGCWGAYRSWCALALWFLDWVLSFSWVSTVAAPLISVGAAMQDVVNRLGVVPTFLTLTALLAGLWMVKGKSSTAVWEVGMACLIAALASGIFSHPVEMVAGQNGYVVKANQVGQELAAELSTGSAHGKTPEQLRQAQVGQLVDTFIRQPTQMINFGRVIDGTKCESAYNEVIAKGPYGMEDTIRDKMSACDDSLGEYASNPSASMAIGSVVFVPASFVILLLALVLAGSVMAAAIWAMFLSVKAIVTLVTGLLPGGGRGSLMLTVAETFVALLIIIFTSVFLSVFLLVIQAMFAGASGDAVPKTFVIVDVVIIVGILVYWRQRQQIKAASQRMAQWMSQRPGGAAATRMPDRSRLSLAPAATAVRTVASVAQLRAQRANRGQVSGPMFIDNRRQAAMFFGGLPDTGGTVVQGEVVPDSGPGPGRPQLPGGPDRPQLPGGPTSPQLPPGGGTGGTGGRGRVLARKGITGTLVRAGTSAALSYATGGASTVVTGAAKASRTAQTARRVAVTTRLAAAGANSTPSARLSATGPGQRTQPTAPDRSTTAAAMVVRPKSAASSSRPARSGAERQGAPVVAGEVVRPRLAPVRPAAPAAPASSTSSSTSAKRQQPGPSRPGPEAPPRQSAPAGREATENAERAARLQARLAGRTRRSA